MLQGKKAVKKEWQELLRLGLQSHQERGAPRWLIPQCNFPFAVFQVYLTAGKAYQLEKTLKELEEGAQHSGTTDSELSELEDKVASAAAQVQQAESEVRA